jgi:hypothetical protein
MRALPWNLVLVAIAIAFSACGRDGGGAKAGGPPQEELAAAFEAATETVFEARTPAQLGAVKAAGQATIVPADNGVQVTATGDDPALQLPPFAAGKRFIMQVVIQSPADTGIQLFYKVAGDAEYIESRAPLYALTAGRNTVYWRVDGENGVDPLRLDPGYTPGTDVIESIVAKALPAAAR